MIRGLLTRSSDASCIDEKPVSPSQVLPQRSDLVLTLPPNPPNLDATAPRTRLGETGRKSPPEASRAKKRKLNDVAMSGHGNSSSSSGFATRAATPLDQQHSNAVPPERNGTLEDGEESSWLDPADKPVHFLREFHSMEDQRQDVQNLRIQLREDRKSLKRARQMLLDAFSTHLGKFSSQDQVLSTSHHLDDILQKLRDLEEKEFAYDHLEGLLIPAEYNLQVSEEDLYTRMLTTTSPLPNGSENEPLRDYQLPMGTKGSGKGSDVSHADYNDIISTSDSNSVSRIRYVKDSLAKLEAEHEDLRAESTRRAKFGVQLDEYSQSLLNSYHHRRGQLWQELVALETRRIERATATDDTRTCLLGIGAQFNDIDSGPLLDQVIEIKPGIFRMNRLVHGNDRTSLDMNLILRKEDFQARANVLGTGLFHSQVQTVNDFFPHITLQEGIAPDEETLFEIVCTWLLKCAESSWFSLTRLFNDNFDAEGSPDYALLKNYFISKRPGVLFGTASLSRKELESLNSARLPSVDEDKPVPVLDFQSPTSPNLIADTARWSP